MERIRSIGASWVVSRVAVGVALIAPACVPVDETSDGPTVAAQDVVGRGSCANSCGGKSKTGTCWCDDACIQDGNCCLDKPAACDDGASWQTTQQHHMTEHAALLPTGNVMLWGLWDTPEPALWDPIANTLRRIPGPQAGPVIYNAGEARLADGRIAIVGGGARHKTPRVFDPVASASVSPWSNLGNVLANARFYPTVVELGSGALLVASGDYLTGPDSDGPSQGLPAEVWEPSIDRWIPIVDRSRPEQSPFLPSRDLFPSMHLLPSGHLVSPPIANDFSRARDGSILALDGPRVTITYRGESASVPSTTRGWTPLGVDLERRTKGASVLSIDDTVTPPAVKLLAVGGGTDSSELVDLTDEARPRVTRARLAFTRNDHPGLVPLPNGDIVVFDGDEHRAQPPETFRDGAWSNAGPPPRFGRGYHGVAVLVPDGRIVVSSDGLVGRPDRVFDQTLEIFTPKTARKDVPRPLLTTAPTNAQHGDTVGVTLASSVDPARIAFASLLRPSAVTHGTDAGARFVKLRTAKVAGRPRELQVTIPSENTAPPGDWLLFVVDDRGIASVGRFLRIAKHSTP